MNFGQAIESLKAGKKVSREGWNGKNMWLCYMPPFVVENPNERTQAHGITGPRSSVAGTSSCGRLRRFGNPAGSLHRLICSRRIGASWSSKSRRTVKTGSAL